MYTDRFKVVSCRKSEKGTVILQLEDLDNPEYRYTEFGERFLPLVGCPYGTRIDCTLVHMPDFKSGARRSVINDFEIVKD